MQVSGSDSHAPFAHTHFFAEAVKDENATRAVHSQNENHSREVDSHHALGREDIVDIQHSPDGVHGTAGTNKARPDISGDQESTTLFPNKTRPGADKQAAAEQNKARFFDNAGQISKEPLSNSVVDVIG